MLPALAIALSLLCAAPDFSRLAEGDIIFQETSGRQSDAIALATKSRYTHVGIVFREKGRWMVLEAVQPVSSIALERWIARGVKRHYVVKRLAAAPGGIGPDAVQRMKAAAVKYLGRDTTSSSSGPTGASIAPSSYGSSTARRWAWSSRRARSWATSISRPPRCAGSCGAATADRSR